MRCGLLINTFLTISSEYVLPNWYAITSPSCMLRNFFTVCARLLLKFIRLQIILLHKSCMRNAVILFLTTGKGNLLTQRCWTEPMERPDGWCLSGILIKDLPTSSVPKCTRWCREVLQIQFSEVLFLRLNRELFISKWTAAFTYMFLPTAKHYRRKPHRHSKYCCSAGKCRYYSCCDKLCSYYDCRTYSLEACGEEGPCNCAENRMIFAFSGINRAHFLKSLSWRKIWLRNRTTIIMRYCLKRPNCGETSGKSGIVLSISRTERN